MGKYVTSDQGKRLSKLGREYVDSITRDQLNETGEFDVAKRTAYQISKANKVIVESRWFIHRVANCLLDENGWKMGKGGIVSLKGFRIKPEELVPEGIIAVLENLDKYDYEKAGMTTFIGEYAAGRMYDMGTKYTGLPLKRRDFKKGRAAVKRAAKRKISLEESLISKFDFKKGVPMNGEAASAIVLGMSLSKTEDIDRPAYPNQPDGPSWQSIYLEDEKWGSEDYVENLDLVEKVRRSVRRGGASKRDIDIIESRSHGIKLKELGKRYSITGEMVRRIEKRVKGKLKRRLREFSD